MDSISTVEADVVQDVSRATSARPIIHDVCMRSAIPIVQWVALPSNIVSNGDS